MFAQLIITSRLGIEQKAVNVAPSSPPSHQPNMNAT